MPAHGVRDAKELDIIAESEAQILVEATPTTVRTPGPSLERLKAAFRTGKHVICVNKAPLAVAFPALQELSRHIAASSATRAPSAAAPRAVPRRGGHPRQRGRRRPRHPQRHHELHPLEDGQGGLGLRQGLAEAQRLGYAEADPSSDIDGIDTATKIVILANGVLGRPCTISDVEDRRHPRPAALEGAGGAQERKVIKLIAQINRDGLSVSPQEVPPIRP